MLKYPQDEATILQGCVNAITQWFFTNTMVISIVSFTTIINESQF
jgi:hypothetical protein